MAAKPMTSALPFDDPKPPLRGLAARDRTCRPGLGQTGIGGMLSLLLHLGILAAILAAPQAPPSPQRIPDALTVAITVEGPPDTAPQPFLPPASPAPSDRRAFGPSAPKPSHKPKSWAAHEKPTLTPTAPTQTVISGGGEPVAPLAGSDGADRKAEDGASSQPGGSGPGPFQPASDPIPLYLASIRAVIQSHLIYPDEARRWGLQGTVHLRFTVSLDGTIDEAMIRFTDDDDSIVLKKGARQTLASIGQLPPPPLGAMTVDLPITFKLIR